jgi:hypothetical protein
VGLSTIYIIRYSLDEFYMNNSSISCIYETLTKHQNALSCICKELAYFCNGLIKVDNENNTLVKSEECSSESDP